MLTADLLMGVRFGCPRFEFEFVNAMLGIQLLFFTKSHCLPGTIAFSQRHWEQDLLGHLWRCLSSCCCLQCPEFYRNG